MNYFYKNRSKFCKEHDYICLSKLMNFYENAMGYEYKKFYYTACGLIENFNIKIFKHRGKRYIKSKDLNLLVFILKDDYGFKELDTDELTWDYESKIIYV